LYSGEFGFHIALLANKFKNLYSYRLYFNDSEAIQYRFKIAHGYSFDLDNPNTLNEKIQWLKINDRTALHTLLADKWKVRDYIKGKYGDDILTDVVFQTENWNDIVIENMPNFPFIIKPNHGSGWYHIVYDKTKVNWNHIRSDCRFWLAENYYQFEREWQYKHIQPCLIVEKLVIPQKGGLPNNYRLHCLSGKVEMISINICFDNPNKFIAKKFDKNWNQLDFKFGVEMKDQDKLRNIIIYPPKSLDKMIDVAENIAKHFSYVRVDFYEVDNKMYFNEITFHDSGGYDKIIPFEWDVKLGKLIDLPPKKRTDVN
jgi:hypothetical protein